MKLSSSLNVGNIMKKGESHLLKYVYYQFNQFGFEKKLMTLLQIIECKSIFIIKLEIVINTKIF